MKNAVRNQLGVSGLVIIMGTAFMIILPLGFLGYEFMRYSLVQQELKSVADAAALAGAVGIATNGGGGNTIWQQEEQAMSGSYNSFCENSVSDCQFVPVGQSMANVNPDEGSSTIQPSHFNNATPFSNVAPHTAQVNFVLIDNNGNQTNWSPGSGPNQSNLTSASSLRVDAYYGYSLPILGALSIGPFTMTASGTGGLPQLDVILLFDMSGSMDDFSNVTFVNRYWVDTKTSPPGLLTTDLTQLGLSPSTFTGGCVEYDIQTSRGSYSPNPPFWTLSSNGTAAGPLYYVTGCNTQSASSNGTSVNVQPPMNLNQEELCPIPFAFMAGQRNSGQGLPPGNFNATTPTTGVTVTPNLLPCYTDLLFNLNGDAQWPVATAATAMGVHFTDPAWGVEAARGNLETSAALMGAVNPGAGNPATDNHYGYIINNLTTGQKHYGSFSSVKGAGQPGSQFAYWSFVQANTHPLSDSITAAQNFFTFLNGSADCHFGLVCFSDGIGTSPTSTWANGSESPPGAALINNWTTASVNGVSASPPLSANIAGHYVGGAAMGIPDSINAAGVDPNGVDLQCGNGVFLLPLVELSPNFDNFTTFNPTTGALVNTVMNPGNGQVQVDNLHPNTNTMGIVATGSTDITDALAEAVRELTPSNGFTRPNATRAIVLFTDGSPNIDSSNMPPAANFTACVSDCGTQGTAASAVNPPITIFSIGLAMDPGMVSNQSILLTTVTNAANGGSSSGPSTWQQITNASQINTAFQSIAKNLVVITK
jgi:Putative Flp pilus-assembly TadE/G-like